MSSNIDQMEPESGRSVRDAISAIAGWLGLILLVATIGYYAVTGLFDLPARILLIAAFVALTAYVWLNPESIAAMATGKGTRNILTTVIMIVLGIALVIAINWIYGLFATRLTGEFGRIDMTAGQSLTLSAQSISAAKSVPAGTGIVGFFRSDATGTADRRTAENLMKEYTKYNPDLRVSYVDPDVDPVSATQFGLTRVDVLVVTNGTRYQVATALTEQAVSEAMLKLIGGGTVKTVGILNTPSLLSFSGTTGDTALSAATARAGLANEDFTVLPLINLVVSPTIEVNDVNVLIVPPSPAEQPLGDTEVRAIISYLDRGGHVLLIGDPLAAPLPAAILSKFGLTEPRHIVVEQSQSDVFGNSPLNLVVFNYPGSTITTDMENIPTLFRTAGIIQPPTSTITGFVATTVIQSSSTAFPANITAGADGQSTLEPVADAATGAQLPMAVSVEQSAPDASAVVTGTKPLLTRLVVVTDMDFASDDLMGQTGVGNRDLFNNMVNWLAQSEERISVRPQDTTDRTMFLSNEQKNLIAWSTIVFLPLLALVGGGVVWWRRR